MAKKAKTVVAAAAPLPLRNYQRQALEVLQRYLAEGSSDSASLISMPTGTGKSAVIAALVAENPEAKDIVVVAPRTGLARQLREDLDARIWAALGVARPQSFGVVRAIPSAQEWIAAVASPADRRRIWVGTIQMLVEVWKNCVEDEGEMHSVCRNLSFAIVDECHYEPSERWSAAIRATGLKTCLLTATAFRNDDRYFNVDTHFTYRYPHRDAEVAGVLRQPQFYELAESGTDASTFVASMRARLKRIGIDKSDRVIVRCGNADDIRSVVATLNAEKQSAVGFHHTFKTSSDPHLYADVPGPAHRPDATYWVHQYKLTEGFDDPRMRALVFYEDFGNDRSVVQQIGRVLRNINHREGDPAIVLTRPGSGVADTWSRYMAFDAEGDQRSVALFPSLVEDMFTAQPETVYWAGLFRHRLNLGASDAWREFKYAKNVRVWMAPTGYKVTEIDDLARAVADEWTHANRRTYGPLTPGAAHARVLPFVSLRNSPVLRAASFVEARLGYTALVLLGGHLFVADSEGASPSLLEDHGFRPVRPDTLQRVLPAGSRVTTVSLTNSDTSAYAIRARSTRARDLAEVASEIGESTYSCSTAQAYVAHGSDTVVRYVGTKNGRVRDTGGTGNDFESFERWVRSLSDFLRNESESLPVLARYAPPVEPPADPKPVHVLLDPDYESFRVPGADDSLLVTESGGAVDDDGRFTVVMGGEEHVATIRWDAMRERYIITSPSLDGLPHRSERDSGRGLLHAINSNQAMRVVSADGLVYSNGNFWSLTSARSGGDAIFSVLQPVDALGRATAEKGTATAAGWPSQTVFGIVEEILFPDHFPRPDSLLLCTDLGKEIADFIACDDGRVAFIHAKAKSDGKPGTVSASAFHEVASQAIKNLRYLSIGNDDVPQTAYWGKPWRVEGRGETDRHRKGPVLDSGPDYWKHINARIQSHAVEREVWVVSGASLSKSILLDQFHGTPSPEAAQVHVLLTGLWSSAQQAGVRLRVFCSP